MSHDDPDASDLEKALRFAANSRFARRLGAGEVWVAGALGGRLDQQLSNFQLVARYAQALRLRLIDPTGAAEVISGRVAFQADKGETVSIFPVETSARVRSRGLKYPLKGAPLLSGSRGLSNIAVASKVTLQVLGRVWLVRSRLPWP